MHASSDSVVHGLWWTMACAASERGAPPVQLYDLQETMSSEHLAFQVRTLADGRLVVAIVGGPIFFDGVRWQVVNHPRMLAASMPWRRPPKGACIRHSMATSATGTSRCAENGSGKASPNDSRRAIARPTSTAASCCSAMAIWFGS